MPPETACAVNRAACSSPIEREPVEHDTAPGPVSEARAKSGVMNNRDAHP